MDRSRKRLIDKVSIFFQRRWWRRAAKHSDTDSAAPISPETPSKSNSIRKQDSAVSVSSDKLPSVQPSKAASATTSSQLVIAVSSPVKGPSADQSLLLISQSIYRLGTLKRHSQLSKPTFRRSRAPAQSDQDANADKVSDILHGVDSIKLKNKSSVGRARTILRSRRVGSKKQPEDTLSPAQVVAKLNECSFRKISIAEVKEVQRNLENGDGQWEEAFLKAGGYEALNFILWEIASSTKRQVIHEIQCSDDLLLEIATCYKLLLTHSSGAKTVFSNLQPIYLIRDLLLGISGHGKLNNFNVGTRLSLLQVLNQLQLVDGENGQGGAGYRLLYQLLCDVKVESESSTSSKTKKPESYFLNRSLPIKRFSSSQDFKLGTSSPMFSSWMRELAVTVDQSIKPASFLAGVLDYKFDVIPSSTICHEDSSKIDTLQEDNNNLATPLNKSCPTLSKDVNGLKTLTSLVDSTAIVYLITHLKLMQKIIQVPAVLPSSGYGLLEQENVRREFFRSGFNSIAASLLACPYHDLRNSYIRPLTSLLHARSS